MWGVLRCLGAFWRCVGEPWRRLSIVLGRRGGVLGASWKLFGSMLLESLIFDRCMTRNHHFHSSRESPKPSWGPLGVILESSWTLPGSLGGVLGRLGSVLEFLGCSWRSLEASGTVQERSKSSPERSRRRSQRLQDASKTASDGFQGVLGTFWNRFGSIC